MSSSVWKKWRAHELSETEQIVSTICYKINLSWHPVSSKLSNYTCEHRTLIVYSVYRKLILIVFIEVIWKYNKDPVFLNHSVVYNNEFAVYVSCT